MSESGDYNPGPWKGHNFDDAKKVYNKHVDRSYGDAKSKSVKPQKCIPKSVRSESESPLVIAIDVTGSMGDWPATIFSKLPYLDKEGQEYLGEDMEICFAAVGDMFSDQYPLQVQPFSKDLDMKKALQKLIIEGNGGGQTRESYELAATYFVYNAEIPNAIKPIFIFIGDEGFYGWVDKDGAKEWALSEFKGRMSGKEMLEELKKKFSVYLIRKPYDRYSGKGDHRTPTDKRIQEQWEDALGADHVCELPDAGRVVDVIFGILAEETGRVPYFKKEIKDRQKPAQVKVAMESLVSIHSTKKSKKKAKAADSLSVTKSKKKSKSAKSISLLDED